MSFSPKRTRSERVASLGLQQGRLTRWAEVSRRTDVLFRLGVCLLAAIVLWCITCGWKPPFPFRTGEMPRRDVVSRVEFRLKDEDGTRELIRQKRTETPCVYRHDARRLLEFRGELKAKLFQIIRAESYDKVSPALQKEFFPATEMAQPGVAEKAFQDLKDSLAHDMDLAHFEKALAQTLADAERDGLLEKLEHEPKDGSTAIIYVNPNNDESVKVPVKVDDVRIPQVLSRIEKRLPEELREAKIPEEHLASLANTLMIWFKQKDRLPVTLALNKTATDSEWREILHSIAIKPVIKSYPPGTTLALRAHPVTEDALRLLRLEHEEFVNETRLSTRFFQSIASFGLYIAVYVLCGVYIFYRKPRILTDLRKFVTLLATVVCTITLCWLAAYDHWRAEIIPLILFSMTVAIAYEQELALLLIATISLVVTLALGHGLAQFVVVASASAAAVLLTGRIRSRTRLIYVGLMVGSVAFMTSLGVCTLTGQALGSPSLFDDAARDRPPMIVDSVFAISLLAGAAWVGVCSVLAGLLMTGILPFIEKIFDVQTDISLLELGDAAHPLLQELVRRAPGTYNHSINVASIAEAAAESIGANGLLVRVGAYFHDIGKMLKPAYFIENQGQDVNRHLSLLPAMSTLVIIAHVKDGANLARQHHLPQSIIDFIEQHHGTTLVEYFYRQAAKQSEADPDASEVDETSFRYPGPKPQIKETGVLMLSDAVESASRTLVDPTPSRIENLVHEITMKRLLDGQFSECGLTLQEIHTIEESLVKSLTAVYHGRVKYPDQQPA